MMRKEARIDLVDTGFFVYGVIRERRYKLGVRCTILERNRMCSKYLLMDRRNWFRLIRIVLLSQEGKRKACTEVQAFIFSEINGCV